MYSFDEVLKNVGDFGRFQKFLLAVIAIPCMLTSWQCFLHAFLGYIPAHRCWVDGCDTNATDYNEKWTNFTAPIEKVNGEVRANSCFVYNVTHILEGSCSQPPQSNDTVSCTRWKSSTDEFRSTIATEWQLYCDDEWLVSLAGSINMAGGLVGLFLFGYIADRFGRKIGILTCTGLLAVFGVGAAFAVNIYHFAAMRFAVEAVESSLYQILFVLAMEFIGPGKRVLAAQIIQLIYSCGEMLLALLAYLVNDWHTLQLLTTVPSVLFLSYYWFLPESARWLMANGKQEKAADVLKQVAHFNKGILSEEMTVQYGSFQEVDAPPEPPPMPTTKDSEELISETRAARVNALHLFKTPRLRMRTLIIMMSWFLNVLVYTGVTLNATALGNNAVLTFFWTALVEVPANLLCIFIFDRFGRRLSLSGSFFLTGVPLVAMQFIPVNEDDNWIAVALSLVGKFGSTIGNAVIYLFAAEIFPTVLRNSGMGICGIMGSLASIVAPQVTLFGQYQESLPYIVFGIGSLLGGLLSLLLPETLKQKLPETIEEAESFGGR